MTVNSVLRLKQGDTSAWPAITIMENGSARDLTTASTIVIYMRPLGSTTNKIDGSSVAITTAASGIVTYTPTAGDMDTAGIFRAEFLITWADATKTTWPNDAEIDTDEDYVRVEIAANLQ